MTHRSPGTIGVSVGRERGFPRIAAKRFRRSRGKIDWWIARPTGRVDRVRHRSSFSFDLASEKPKEPQRLANHATRQGSWNVDLPVRRSSGQSVLRSDETTCSALGEPDCTVVFELSEGPSRDFFFSISSCSLLTFSEMPSV
jgi:hypothetical protein